jgi:hypothetical protein
VDKPCHHGNGKRLLENGRFMKKQKQLKYDIPQGDSGHGGKRSGAGRKKETNKRKCTLAFRVTVAEWDMITKHYEKKGKKNFAQYARGLIFADMAK